MRMNMKIVRMNMRKIMTTIIAQDWKEQQLPRLQTLLSPSSTFSEEPFSFMDTGEHHHNIMVTISCISYDQVLCPSEFSDPVFPVQEHCLLHRTGAAATLKRGHLQFNLDPEFPFFRCFTCSTPTSVLRYQHILLIGLKTGVKY